MLFSFITTLLMYLLAMFYLPNYINVSFIFNRDALQKIAMVTFITWFPFFVAKKLTHVKNELTN